MGNPLLRIFRVPAEIYPDFQKKVVDTNRISLRLVSGIMCCAEVYNIIRVLFMTNAKLSTFNNRVYFGFYVSLLVVAAGWLLADRRLCRADYKLQYRVQFVCILAMFSWNICLNSYDLYRDADSGVMVFSTAMLGLASFIRLPYSHSFALLALGFGGFRLLAGPWLKAGVALNLGINFVLALGIAYTNTRHVIETLVQQREIHQMNDQLQAMVEQDPLTGLLNQGALRARVERELKQLDGANSLTFLVVDMDGFKYINDNFGHPCGDYVLIETAARLRETFPEASGVGRIGGDEFAVVLPGAQTQQQMEERSRLLRQSLAAIQWQGQPVGAGCSVGVCVCRDPSVTHEKIYVQTDRMLYKAKESGRGCCCYQELG